MCQYLCRHDTSMAFVGFSLTLSTKGYWPLLNVDGLCTFSIESDMGMRGIILLAIEKEFGFPSRSAKCDGDIVCFGN